MIRGGWAAIAASMIAVLSTPAHALAWGAEGHHVIAVLAFERLTPKAQKAADDLIRQANIQNTPACSVATVLDASTWPDCVRGTHDPRFAALTPDHYEDTPLCGDKPRAVYCPNGQCVTEAVKRAVAALSDTRRPAVERVEALEEVIHFVGDMHQPLHMTDNGDRGGNEVTVEIAGQPTNLHHTWDTELVVDALSGSEGDAEAQLRPLIVTNARAWSRGDIDAWGLEAHQIAVAFAYPKLATPPACDQHPPIQTISTSYIDASGPVVRQQMARAAVRLAVVLNGALSATAQTSGHSIH